MGADRVGSPHEPPARTSKSDFKLNVALSLLGCFDFDSSGVVNRSDWKRGTDLLCLPDIGKDDDLWSLILRTYGAYTEADKPRGYGGEVHVEDIAEASPMAADPLLISHVVKALIQRVADCTDKVDKLRARVFSQGETHPRRALLEAKRRTLHPPLLAWRQLARHQRELLGLLDYAFARRAR